MKGPRQWRYAAEYALTRATLGLADVLPPGYANAMGRYAGYCAYALDGRRRRTAIDNILRAGLAESTAGAKSLARRAFAHFGQSIAETLNFDRRFDPDCPGKTLIEDIDPEVRELMGAAGQGFMLVSGHVGNWEVAARIVSAYKPVAAIARNLKNPHVDALLKRRRTADNLALIPKRSTDLGRLLRVIKQGDILALLFDQYGQDRGIWVDFFDRPARTHASPAMLHLITRAPICFGACVRESDGRFRLIAPAPIRYSATGDRTGDVQAILEIMNRHLESVIRRYPDQYLWAHRRWKDPPPA